MEPVTLTATAIATLIFSEALKEGGKALGKGVSETFAQLLITIREKFRAVGTEGLLTRIENQPTEPNKSIFQAELENQMKDDREFANQLRELFQHLQADEGVRQKILSGIELSGDLKAKDIIMRAMRGGSKEMEILTDVKAQNIDLGNITMES
jgi:hypothetical protein